MKHIPTFESFVNEKGLWDNMWAKRKRGEKPAKPGDEDYPKKDAWKQAQESEEVNESLTVKDYDEFVNPDHVLVTLSDGRKLKIEKKRIQGGQKVYQAILQSLDAYNDNPKAKLFIDNVINGMAKQLS